MNFADAEREGKLQDIVLDTMVFFDLHTGYILSNILFLRDHFCFHATNFIENEIKSIDPRYTRLLSVKFEDSPGHEISRIHELRNRYTHVSLEDHSAMVLANRLGCKLITRDGFLIEAKNIEYPDIQNDHTIWLVEQMIEHDILNPEEANSAIDRIISKLPMFKDGIGMDRLKRIRNLK